MFRTLVYLLVSLFLIVLLRAVIGLIGKAVGELFQPASPQKTRDSASQTPFGGELKKDPVCGVFVSEAAAIKKKVGSETLYFCSTACRDRFSS